MNVFLVIVFEISFFYCVSAGMDQGGGGNGGSRRQLIDLRDRDPEIVKRFDLSRLQLAKVRDYYRSLQKNMHELKCSTDSKGGILSSIERKVRALKNLVGGKESVRSSLQRSIRQLHDIIAQKEEWIDTEQKRYCRRELALETQKIYEQRHNELLGDSAISYAEKEKEITYIVRKMKKNAQLIKQLEINGTGSVYCHYYDDRIRVFERQEAQIQARIQQLQKYLDVFEM